MLPAGTDEERWATVRARELAAPAATTLALAALALTPLTGSAGAVPVATGTSTVEAAAQAATTAPALPRAAKGCGPAGRKDPEEPACNRFLADSPWSGNHRSSYAQASSPLPGLTGPAELVDVDHDGFASAPVVLSFSPRYPDGGRVVWASTVGPSAEVLKIDPRTMTVVDKYIPLLEEGSGVGSATVSGAYNVVDAENRLHVGQSTALEVYGDAVRGERLSSIALLRRFELPASALCGEDSLVGITMTYDGRIAFATENGVVGVVPRQPARMTEENLRTFSVNGEDCAGGPDGTVETVSNSIAADERGGVYVVTSDAMYRIDLRGDRLVQRWRASYAGAGGSGGGRLGVGSGSTPTLMGTAPGDDRFVVITDGQELMHLVLMWRDRIPRGWEPVREGADPRIACEIPVTFGDPDATRSLSEQSVLVRGHSAVVVNNLMQLDPVLGQLPPQAAPLSQLLSGLPGNEPRGVQRFDWDARTRTCDVAWTNPDVAIPNGIPTMSSASDLFYGIGSRDGIWTLEALEWETGRLELTVPTTAFPTSNSFYAATTLGPGGSVWTGTFGGVTRFSPCDPERRTDCGRRLDPVEASVGTLPGELDDLLQDTIGLPNDGG